MRDGLDLFDLSDRRALITGSSQGIGLTPGRGLAVAGAQVVLNGRSEEKLAQVVAGLAESGAVVATPTFDVTDADGVRTAIDTFEAETAPIDILVNNAGMQHRGRWRISIRRRSN